MIYFSFTTWKHSRTIKRVKVSLAVVVAKQRQYTDTEIQLQMQTKDRIEQFSSSVGMGVNMNKKPKVIVFRNGGIVKQKNGFIVEIPSILSHFIK